jgi:outer membrane protein assembly factor BamA
VPAPPPPPSTIGTPVDAAGPNSPPGGAGAPAATPSPSPPPPIVEPEPSSGGIVRAPGRVGLKYLLEGIEVRGNTTTLARVVLRYVPFSPGDTLDVDDRELELTRFRLLGTGFFQDVRLSLRRGSRRGNAILVVTVVERNTIVLNGLWLGLSTDANPSGSTRPLTAYGGIDVAETNLAGTGVTLGGALAIADNQLGLRARFADPIFLHSNWTAEALLLYNRALDFFGNNDVLVQEPTQTVAQDYAVVSYQRFGGYVGAGHDLGTTTRLSLDYHLEKIDASVPLAASDHRGLDIAPIDFYIHPGSSILSSLRATFIYDTRNDPFLPTKGTFLSLAGNVSLTPLGSDYPFVKLTVGASQWFTMPWGHVLKLDAFAGVVVGDAPMFEMFYVGDLSDLLPDRVLDLAFDRRAAPNFFNTDIALVRYGAYAAKLDAEYRVPIYRGARAIYGIDLFASAGLYGLCNQQDLVDPARGYSGFGTVPIDFTFNLGIKADTSAGGFSFGISNYLGFIPVRSGSQ